MAIAKQRPLPARPNPLLHGVQPRETPSPGAGRERTSTDHTAEHLASKRRLATTELKARPGQLGLANATKPRNLGRFDYVHLKVPLPGDLRGSGVFPAGATPVPAGYYLMRRCSDGYVSVTGIFKAAFPWASKADEARERAVFAASSAADDAELAGNVWASARFALDLAAEYGIFPWVAALLDTDAIPLAKPSIPPPPAYALSKKQQKLLGTMSSRRRTVSRDLRSASPVKQQQQLHQPPTPQRAKATPRKRKPSKKDSEPIIADSADEDASAAVETVAEEDEDSQDLLDAAAVVEAHANDVDGEPLERNKVRVSITEDIVPGTGANGDTETTRTTVKVELPADSPDLALPKDTEGVVAIARDIIEGAKELQEAEAELQAPASATNGTPGKRGRKRKASVADDQVARPEELVETDAAADGERAAKRTRVMVPAEAYRREKVRRRALMGLSGALAVGVVLPFLSNLF